MCMYIYMLSEVRGGQQVRFISLYLIPSNYSHIQPHSDFYLGSGNLSSGPYSCRVSHLPPLSCFPRPTLNFCSSSVAGLLCSPVSVPHKTMEMMMLCALLSASQQQGETTRSSLQQGETTHGSLQQRETTHGSLQQGETTHGSLLLQKGHP